MIYSDGFMSGLTPILYIRNVNPFFKNDMRKRDSYRLNESSAQNTVCGAGLAFETDFSSVLIVYWTFRAPVETWFNDLHETVEFDFEKLEWFEERWFKNSVPIDWTLSDRLKENKDGFVAAASKRDSPEHGIQPILGRFGVSVFAVAKPIVDFGRFAIPRQSGVLCLTTGDFFFL